MGMIVQTTSLPVIFRFPGEGKIIRRARRQGVLAKYTWTCSLSPTKTNVRLHAYSNVKAASMCSVYVFSRASFCAQNGCPWLTFVGSALPLRGRDIAKCVHTTINLRYEGVLCAYLNSGRKASCGPVGCCASC